MDRPNDAADEQAARWNGVAGRAWVETQEVLDRMYLPLEKRLVEAVAAASARRVLDVGCGAGGTTLAVARLLGATGECVGIDISEPMIDTARARAQREGSPARFIRASAQDHAFEPASFDMIVSRFGVMFFGDPVAAFANLRTGLAPGGRVRFACWRPISENPWLQIPLHAVYEHAPRLPKPEPEEPGPFAFADTDRVTRILTSAGFTAPSFTPLDIQLDIAAGGTLDDAVMQSSEMGPAKRALADQPDDIRVAALDSVRRALAPYASPSGVTLPAAIWLVAATS